MVVLIADFVLFNLNSCKVQVKRVIRLQTDETALSQRLAFDEDLDLLGGDVYQVVIALILVRNQEGECVQVKARKAKRTLHSKVS